MKKEKKEQAGIPAGPGRPRRAAACLALPALLLCACTGNRPAPDDDNAFDDVTQEVPVDSIPNAPADQIEALTELPPDSTDLLRDYAYEGNYIYISKPRMRLYVLTPADSVVYSCRIACGLRRGDKQEKGDYRTPEGHFRIAGMFESTEWIHRTRDGREVKGCYGPWFLRLRTGRFAGIGIHGTNAPRSIGRRASEGCIRVSTPDIIRLREEYAYEGMPVIVSGEYERMPDFHGLSPRAATPPDTLPTPAARPATTMQPEREPDDTAAPGGRPHRPDSIGH